MASTAPSPAARWRPLLLRLTVLAGAVGVGLLLQALLAERLAAITAHAEHDVVAARRELAFLMRGVALPVLALTMALGAALARSAHGALREERFPPAGSRLWGRGRQVLTGAPARRFARIGIGLGVALALCSLAAAGLLWWMTYVLLLCRA